MDPRKIEISVDIIKSAIEEYDPVKVYALVSGGNDSTVVGHLAVNQGPGVDAFVHINTGIGVEQTREHVRAFAQWLETPLIEIHAPKTYEELVMEYGFPGPAAHRYMYIDQGWLVVHAPSREDSETPAFLCGSAGVCSYLLYCVIESMFNQIYANLSMESTPMFGGLREI